MDFGETPVLVSFESGYDLVLLHLQSHRISSHSQAQGTQQGESFSVMEKNEGGGGWWLWW